MKLSDVIELSHVKLVIELEDTETDPDGVINSFILTDEVKSGLKAILKRIDEGKGCGAFIKGNFGSGKSHFLSFLYLLFKGKTTTTLDEKKIPSVDNVIKISLVRYPSSLSLEGILLKNLGYDGKVTDREELFKSLLCGKTVIIIDELSEFLRAKPSPPQFYEDVRFLQFLGEFSMRHPLWIVASLQEWLEETGHISSSIFNRIKDRYPLRINLTSSHIEDIIDQRLLKKRAGALETIKSVYDELRRFYPHLELNLERFKKTYPLHPFTTRFLTGLTRVFSQHRGVIQFVQAEVSKRLDSLADSLITPEAIFDHFIDRLREMPDISNLIRIAFEYYRNNLSLIFQNQLQREVAESVIKILILTELSPLEKRKTAKDLAEMLLKKISTVTDSINYDYIKNGILEPLVAHQMYIMKDGETYFIDITQDEGLRIKARVKAIREKFSDRNYLLSLIADNIALPYLPLRDIKEQKRYRFKWQNSIRECIVLLTEEVDNDDIAQYAENIKKRLDGYLIVLSPLHEFKPFPINLFDSSVYHAPILFWQPRQFSDEEIEATEEYLARLLLINEFQTLKDGISNSEAKFRELVTKAYFDGKIFSLLRNGDTHEIKDIGYLPMERLLSHIFDAPLQKVYPKHQGIMPRLDMYSSQGVNALFSHLIRQGRLTIEEAEKKGIVPLIRGLLEPLGIVSKKGSAYTLHIAGDIEVISYILNFITHEHDLYKLKQGLKKSPWGFMDDQIDLLLSSLIVSGYLMPYGKNGVVEFKEIGQLSSGEIIAIKQGKALDPELVSAIPKGRFIWGDIETAPTPSTIKAMWKEALQFIRKYRKLMDELQAMTNRYREYSIFKLIGINTPILNRISLFVHSIPLNTSPQEGIERFLLFLKEDDDLMNHISHIERLHKFFDEDFQIINKYYLYLTHPALNQSRFSEAITQLKDDLIKNIEDFLKNLSSIDEIRRDWTEFYEKFSSFYKDSHDKFYSHPSFHLRRRAEESESSKALKRISQFVTSITFANEWWEIKRRLEELPEICNADINQELFINPICRCGFRPDMEPPSVDIDIVAMCEEGIRNFIKTIQLPENREKIDSTITGLSISGKADVSKRLLQLMSIDPQKTHITLIISLLDEALLREIENAFKGRWRLKEIRLDELIEKLKGRRFKFDELKAIVLKWLGDDEDSIIHVIDPSRRDSIGEELSIYGIEGKKAEIELVKKESLLDSDGLQVVFDSINLRNFELHSLLELLDKERHEHMKKRLRNEIFERIWNSGSQIDSSSLYDRPMLAAIKAISLTKGANRYNGIDIFKNIIAPLSVLIEGLNYENSNERHFEHGLLQRLQNEFDAIIKNYEKRHDRFDGVMEINDVKEMLSGNIVIMDGLRYDLWVVLKEIMINEGWKVKDEIFRITSPSTTSKFRDAIGIEDARGIINAKSYAIIKTVERDVGKRDLKKFLKGEEEIKFLHFNFIDTRIHGATIDLHPLYEIIKREFATAIIPIFKELGSFLRQAQNNILLLSDHGFTDTKELKERYRHGGDTFWEILLPLADIRL